MKEMDKLSEEDSFLKNSMLFNGEITSIAQLPFGYYHTVIGYKSISKDFVANELSIHGFYE